MGSKEMSSKDAKLMERIAGYVQQPDLLKSEDARQDLIKGVESEILNYRMNSAMLIPKLENLLNEEAIKALKIFFTDKRNEKILELPIISLSSFPKNYVTEVFNILAPLIKLHGNSRRDKGVDTAVKDILTAYPDTLVVIFKSDMSRDVKIKVLEKAIQQATKMSNAHWIGHTRSLVQDLPQATREEFKILVDFMTSIGVRGDLKKILELQFHRFTPETKGQDEREWYMHCLFIAMPLIKDEVFDVKTFLQCFVDHILPQPKFDELSKDVRFYFLRALAEISSFSFTSSSSSISFLRVCKTILQHIVHMLKKCSTYENKGDEFDASTMENLLFIFHHLSLKTNAGILSDHQDLAEHLKYVKKLTLCFQEELTERMAIYNEKFADAAAHKEKKKYADKKHRTILGISLYKNIHEMIQILFDPQTHDVGVDIVEPSWKSDPVSIPSNGFGLRRISS